MTTNFPIVLRSRNRAAFLDVTIRSILASNLPENKNLLVIDDCSDVEIAKKHLFTNDEIILAEPIVWPVCPQWDNLVGKIKTVKGIHGIKDQLEVVQPTTKKGDLGGIFWLIDYMMTRFKNSEAIIVFEADCVVRRDWYEMIDKTYLRIKNEKGPNGNSLGLLTCYNRSAAFGKHNPRYDNATYAWNSVSLIPGGKGNWNCARGIGGVNYLVTRSFYESCKDIMKGSFNPGKKSGDTALQAQCGINKFNIASTSPSFCQHIGFKSLSWPEKGWRYSRNFSSFCFEKFDSNGFAYSDTWIV